MRAAFSKAEIESDIASRFENAFRLQGQKAALTLATGITEVDSLTGGIPRGALSEIFGSASSGRTSLLLSMLSYATTHEEICALVDISDVFAPTAAAPAGIDFDKLLWVRCGANIEHGFKATDLLLHAGGFGLVILDMGDVAGKDARRIISSWWYRFRRTVENKPTAMVVMSAESCTRSCASLTLELDGVAQWRTTNNLQIYRNQKRNVLPIRTASPSDLVAHANLLRVNSIKVNRRRPITASVNESQFSSRNYF
jgi:recA bacterial DNA recombination protein